jgi:hypothetical protein
MILSTDLSNLKPLIIAFRARMQTKKFPEENSMEDK